MIVANVIQHPSLRIADPSLPLFILFLFPLCAGIAADSPHPSELFACSTPEIDGRLDDPV